MNPQLLPKVRSDGLRELVPNQECLLKLGTFIGRPCSGPVSEFVHLDGIAPALGKGQSTKVSDLNGLGGCRVCHGILSRIDPAWMKLMDSHPAAVQRHVHMSHMAQLGIWLRDEKLIVPDGVII